MRHLHYALCALFIVGQACAGSLFVDYRVGDETGNALVCWPEGNGPFPVVIYNHGLIVDRAGYQNASARGYDLDGFCMPLPGMVSWHLFLSEAPVLETFRVMQKRCHEQSIT